MQNFTITEFMVCFEKSHWRGRSIDARRGYRNAVTRFAVFLQRPPRLSDFTPDVLQKLDRWLEMEVAKQTRKSTIGKLRTIWRAAKADGLVTSGPPVVSQARCGIATVLDNGFKVRDFKPFTEAELIAVHTSEEPPATLRDLLPRYAAERGIRPRSAASLHHRLTNFEKLLGRPAKLTDLNDATVNLWTARLFENNLSAVTVRGYRGAILAIWRAAYDLHFLETRPGRIRKIRVKPSLPECWTAEQLGEVFRAFARLQGTMHNDPHVRRASFWMAFVMVGYYSGLRFGDLASLRWDQIQNGMIVVTMSKTGDIITCPLPDDALAMLTKIRGSNRTLVFGQLMNGKNSREFFSRVLKEHGLPGSIKWLRRTSATLLERSHPGAAKAHLGHRTHGLAYKHYVDPRLLQQNKPVPPSIVQQRAA